MSKPTKTEALRNLSFGNQVAEEERDFLSQYFVRTQAWDRIFNGEIDIIYGPKGAGKSAIYVLISSSADALFDRRILLITAENPRGAPAFKDLIDEPPTSEREFVALWKLYLTSLIARSLQDFGVTNSHSQKLLTILTENGLAPPIKGNLASILRTVRKFVLRLATPKSIEGTLHVTTAGEIQGYTGRIMFEEPDLPEKEKGSVSVDNLLELADASLTDAGYKVWVMIDRLDVAFDESSELEKNALRALFRTYRDLRSLDSVELKIFLRTDIWRRITEEGFREATHLSRDIHLEWNKPSLQNLILRRLINNPKVLDLYDIDKEEVLTSSQKQNELFESIFPEQVELGEKQSTTIDWILRRTSDATNSSQPRDIILFLNKLCEVQNKRLEQGEPEPSETFLFDRAAFKEALPALSEYRVSRVLFAEYPHLRGYIEALREQKTEQNAISLGRLWSVAEEPARVIAKQLRDVGFFEERSSKSDVTYWVPFVYRPYLAMSQGKVDEIR